MGKAYTGNYDVHMSMLVASWITQSGAVIGLFLTVLLVHRGRSPERDCSLRRYLLANSLVLTGAWLWSSDLLEAAILPTLYANQLLLPLLYGYVSALLKEKTSGKQKLIHRLLWLPLAVSLILTICLLATIPDFSFGETGADPLVFDLWINTVEFLLPPLVFVLLYRKALAYKWRLKNRMSLIEGLDFRWVRILLAMETVSWLMFRTLSLLQLLPESTQDDSLYAWGFAVTALFVWYLGYNAMTGTDSFYRKLATGRGEPVSKSEDSSEGQIGRYDLEESEVRAIRAEILRALHEEKVYRNPVLSLPELAGRTGEAAHRLSHVINEHMETSFYDLVNSCRVEEVKNRIISGETVQTTLLGLAMDSGFNSKASFNRNFRKYTGETPSAFRKRSHSAD